MSLGYLLNTDASGCPGLLHRTNRAVFRPLKFPRDTGILFSVHFTERAARSQSDLSVTESGQLHEPTVQFVAGCTDVNEQGFGRQ